MILSHTANVDDAINYYITESYILYNAMYSAVHVTASRGIAVKAAALHKTCVDSAVSAEREIPRLLCLPQPARSQLLPYSDSHTILC